MQSGNAIAMIPADQNGEAKFRDVYKDNNTHGLPKPE
eukprot:CAMPEP_0198685190 /NCGR_PEP_ID=MMETSP1468-20131203/13318_1 /TAXON_ID=1461545 /ORGANISM="Mantoniella sp, Strain CCMP1436" /LENGTH=36 /DNA_ID= /DNA_START= /DNA_END= /DNA_ORIENTATION=